MDEKGLLIDIDESIIKESGYMSRIFVKKDIKNRAYINTLGAEGLKKYLSENGFDLEDIYSVHSIARILELLDISDVMLPNIHIDVRVVFDENQIFIPKSHFELEILPDIYVAAKLDYHFDQLEVLGFFTPDSIDKSRADKDYYFMDFDKLSSVDELIEYVKNYKTSKYRDLSDDEMLRGRELSVFLSDHCIEEDDLKEFLDLLCASDKLREAVIEYDNFETLSYSVAHYISKTEKAVKDKENYDYESNEETEVETSDIKIDIPKDLKMEDDSESLTDALLDKTIDMAGKLGSGAIAGAVAGLGTAGASELADLSNEAMQLAGLSGSVIDNIIEGKANQQNENLDKIDLSKKDEVYKNMPDDSDHLYGLPMDDGLEKPVIKTVKDEDFSSDISELETIENTQYAPQDHSHMTVNLHDLPETEGETYQKVDHVTDFDNISKNNNSLNENNSDIIIEDNTDLNTEHQESIEDFSEIENSNDEEFLNIQDEMSEDNTDLTYSEESLEISNSENFDSDIEIIEDIDLSEENGSEIPPEFNNAESSDNSEEDDDLSQKTEDNVSEELSNDDSSEEEKEEESSDSSDVSDTESLDAEETSQNIEADDHAENTQDADITGSETVVDYNDFDNNTNLRKLDENNDSDTDTQENNVHEVDLTNSASVDSTNEITDTEDYSSEEITDDSVVNIEDFVQDESGDDSVVNMSDLLETVKNNNEEQNKAKEVLNQDLPYENSYIIDDSQINIGEIPIDINNIESVYSEDTEHLESIYNGSANLNDNAMLKNPARFIRSGFNKQKSPIGLALFGGIVVLALLGVLGISALKMFKPAPKKPQPLVGNNVSQKPQDNIQDKKDSKVNDNKVVNMPESKPMVTPPSTLNKSLSTPVVSADKPVKKLASSEYIEVSKLSWEVPDYLSYSPEFQQYFQSSGKSLKSVISNDLLLATENVYSDQVRVSVTFNKNGVFQNSAIILSSGSKEVDNIVLRSVNQTLKVLKAPNSLGNDESTTMILKIYF